MQCTMGQLQDAKNYTTKLSIRDRRANIITEIKAKSALNDLKGVWKTIKRHQIFQLKSATQIITLTLKNVINILLK